MVIQNPTENPVLWGHLFGSARHIVKIHNIQELKLKKTAGLCSTVYGAVFAACLSVSSTHAICDEFWLTHHISKLVIYPPWAKTSHTMTKMQSMRSLRKEVCFDVSRSFTQKKAKNNFHVVISCSHCEQELLAKSLPRTAKYACSTDGYDTKCSWSTSSQEDIWTDSNKWIIIIYGHATHADFGIVQRQHRALGVKFQPKSIKREISRRWNIACPLSVYFGPVSRSIFPHSDRSTLGTPWYPHPFHFVPFDTYRATIFSQELVLPAHDTAAGVHFAPNHRRKELARLSGMIAVFLRMETQAMIAVLLFYGWRHMYKWWSRYFYIGRYKRWSRYLYGRRHKW